MAVDYNDTALTNTPVTIVISGEEFKATALTDANFDELTEWARSLIISIARKAIQNGDLLQEERNEILQVAICSAASTSWNTIEGSKILSSIEGFAHTGYLMVRKHLPKNYTEDSFCKLFKKRGYIVENKDEINRIFLRSFPTPDEKEPKGPVKNP